MPDRPQSTSHRPRIDESWGNPAVKKRRGLAVSASEKEMPAVHPGRPALHLTLSLNGEAGPSPRQPAADRPRDGGVYEVIAAKAQSKFQRSLERYGQAV